MCLEQDQIEDLRATFQHVSAFYSILYMCYRLKIRKSAFQKSSNESHRFRYGRHFGLVVLTNAI